ncbi:speriolin-like protein [Centroberyx affinis]|uniref:speriolin-like protein n=1 Tax=Centroberyx affinis TaxID=166261 RepID=UPI003A5C0B73
MDLEQAHVTLLSENDTLRQENDHLKLMLGLVKENIDLRAKVQSSNSEFLKESTGRKTAIQWQDTLDESQFKNDLQQTKFKHAHKTSSAVDFKSFIQSSMHTDTGAKPEFESRQSYISDKVEDPERLLGEIAFQLDRRILSHVFQSQNRLYGFTVLNVPDKIIQVSTHPLTGKVDEGYRLQLSQRFAGLMEGLNQFGYSATLHPPFTEFVINTYGIMKQRPDSHTIQEMDYNNPDFLRQVTISAAPGKLVKDLLLLLNCLSYMAKKDGKPLFLW